jgi:hypothetical protein
MPKVTYTFLKDKSKGHVIFVCPLAPVVPLPALRIRMLITLEIRGETIFSHHHICVARHSYQHGRRNFLAKPLHTTPVPPTPSASRDTMILAKLSSRKFSLV